MKVLIVGAGGYIGERFIKFANSQKNFTAHIVDSYEGWKEKDFSGYDSVIFAAGIAHRRQTKANAFLYFAVNTALAADVAKKAKLSKVRQFVYLSSMAVYGKKEGEISEHTKPNPRHNDYYGQSKYQAEQELKKLTDAEFDLAIIRPPMVYGAECPGKFKQLKGLSKWLPIVPDNRNKRSMIYVDKLSLFLCTIVQEKKAGVFCPQDDEYVNTAALIKQIRRDMGKNTVILPCLGWLVNLAKKICPPLKTAFGSLVYTKEP